MRELLEIFEGDDYSEFFFREEDAEVPDRTNLL